jgi:hypothetical protein
MRKLGLAIVVAALSLAALAVWRAVQSPLGGPSSVQSGGQDEATSGGTVDGGTPSATPIRRDLPRVDLTSETNLATMRLQYASRELESRVDPLSEGWDSEAVAEQIDSQFKVLAQAIAQPDAEQTQAATALEAPGFQCSTLRPRELEKVWGSQGLAVRRAGPGLMPARPARGGLAGELTASFADLPAVDGWASFKTIRVDVERDLVSTVSYFHASRNGKDRGLQLNATWRCRWRLAAPNKPPLLERIEVENHEEIEALLPSGTMFSDVTLTAVGANRSFQEQLRRGENHWVQWVDFTYGAAMGQRYGMAIGDVNGDGLDDVYICQPVGLPNRLLVQDGTGTVVDRSAEAGVDFLDGTAAALLVDLDNDGDPDLVCSIPYHLLVLANDGTGRFTLRADLAITESDVEGLSAIDVDNDGDLDLLQCIGRADASGAPFVYYDARNGGGNLLFRNDISTGQDGAWTFTNITQDVGLARDNYRQSLAAAWEDLDNDGDIDLYVANDYGPKNLFRNDDGRFLDVAREAGVLDPGSGMSVSFGDINRDGLFDLYVGNMFSSAGNRITTQHRRLASLNPAVREVLQRFAKGNSLFQNEGQGKFREVGAEAGVEIARWAWSSLFADLNNDGWEDLYVANGYITNDKIDDL